MMPADVTGFYLHSPNGKGPSFMPGPIFANVVLADELNRTTPRTQSAMLEVMQERQVTIERTTHLLAGPFMVIATQVQSGEGTYPLTGVQVDRFLLRLASEYASKEDEKRMLSEIDRIDQPDIKAATTAGEILELQQLAKKTYVSPEVVDYVASIVESVRNDPDVLPGVSSRASIALYKCSRVAAALDGRDFVIPDDIKRLVPATMGHRIRIKAEAEMDGRHAGDGPGQGHGPGPGAQDQSMSSFRTWAIIVLLESVCGRQPGRGGGAVAGGPFRGPGAAPGLAPVPVVASAAAVGPAADGLLPVLRHRAVVD